MSQVRMENKTNAQIDEVEGEFKALFECHDFSG